jgi:hypothetical protein
MTEEEQQRLEALAQIRLQKDMDRWTEEARKELLRVVQQDEADEEAIKGEVIK